MAGCWKSGPVSLGWDGVSLLSGLPPCQSRAAALASEIRRQGCLWQPLQARASRPASLRASPRPQPLRPRCSASRMVLPTPHATSGWPPSSASSPRYGCRFVRRRPGCTPPPCRHPARRRCGPDPPWTLQTLCGRRGRRCHRRQRRPATLRTPGQNCGQTKEDGARAGLALAQFVGLDLALVVLDQHANCAELDFIAGLVPLLDCVHRLISSRFVLQRRRVPVVLPIVILLLDRVVDLADTK